MAVEEFADQIRRILDRYDIDDRGIIRTRGKFEGEYLFAPVFYDLALNGYFDDEAVLEGEFAAFLFRLGDSAQDKELLEALSMFEPDPEQRKETRKVRVVIITETANGFVYAEYYTSAREGMARWKEIQEMADAYLDADELD